MGDVAPTWRGAVHVSRGGGSVPAAAAGIFGWTPAWVRVAQPRTFLSTARPRPHYPCTARGLPIEPGGLGAMWTERRGAGEGLSLSGGSGERAGGLGAFPRPLLFPLSKGGVLLLIRQLPGPTCRRGAGAVDGPARVVTSPAERSREQRQALPPASGEALGSARGHTPR